VRFCKARDNFGIHDDCIIDNQVWNKIANQPAR
jgi:hypothetical protein